MWPYKTRQQLLQEEEIEDLLQEIARLKLRLYRIKRRRDSSPKARDFNGVRRWCKYAPIKDSRSFVPTKAIHTVADDEEGMTDNQISFIHKDVFEEPSRESSASYLIEPIFDRFQDSLSKSSSLPLFDEPVYDEYEDDRFDQILDLKQPAYDDDGESKLEDKPTTRYGELTSEQANEDCDFLLDAPENEKHHTGSFSYHSLSSGDVSLFDGRLCGVDIGKLVDLEHLSLRGVQWQLEESKKFEELRHAGETTLAIAEMEKANCKAAIEAAEAARRIAEIKALREEGEKNIKCKCPDWFSQPNPSPYGGQPDFFLVWIKLRKERFPVGNGGKLKPRADGPFRVIHKINDSAYQIYLPGDSNVSPVFNVADLTPHYEVEEFLPTPKE